MSKTNTKTKAVSNNSDETVVLLAEYTLFEGCVKKEGSTMVVTKELANELRELKLI